MPERKIDVESVFGVDVFDDTEMRRHLPRKVYENLCNTIEKGEELDPALADDVAHGMKEWALSKGATHYTHFFQPLNGLTAEKHDSFISIPDRHGKVIMEFSGKELVKGEPDASSFPSGGLRATFEARGYTAWDCTSPAFVIRDDWGCVLYIPTAFCSYTGEALDEKTPLLRSMDYLSSKAIEVLRLFGDEESEKVFSYVGAEQEYFLIDSDKIVKRKDLVYTGRTLFGAPAPKGQELEDHYFGPIRDKISSFMGEVNEVLWRLGIPAKTEHNEVAPSQHELATIFSKSNVAADQNQLVMNVLKRVAKKHGLICLLAEKPFDGINGSGKHNNWSIGTDKGRNLFVPDGEGTDDTVFLVFLTSVIRALSEYGPLLRESVASYGNDFRLGANEAPPAIISIFLGDELQGVVDQIVGNGKGKKNRSSLLKTGVSTLPVISKDNTDRNRTSPFAFTGNKFEFRMVGSESNISECNTVLNTIVGYELDKFLEYIKKNGNSVENIYNWIRTSLKEHSKVIFNGDGYSKEWVEEATRRGLPILPTAVDAIDALSDSSIKELFDNTGVLSATELSSRQEIKYENYAKEALIDGKTMSHMARKIFLTSVNSYLSFLNKEKKNGVSSLYIDESIEKVSKLLDESYVAVKKLDEDIAKAEKMPYKDMAHFVKDVLKKDMADLRKPLDELELIVDKSYWPVPSYGDLLFHTI